MTAEEKQAAAQQTFVFLAVISEEAFDEVKQRVRSMGFRAERQQKKNVRR